jgi:hypothetical protein
VNPTQLFLFIGLPIIVGIAGVLAGETFRAKNMTLKEGLGTKSDVVPEEAKDDGEDMATILASIRRLIAEDTSKPLTFFGGGDAEQYLHSRVFIHGLDNRHRDQAGEIRQKRSDVLIGTLRRSYGEGFARGLAGNERLRDVLTKLDSDSLSKLFHDYEAGTLYNVLTFSRYVTRR